MKSDKPKPNDSRQRQATSQRNSSTKKSNIALTNFRRSMVFEEKLKEAYDELHEK